MEWEEQLHQYVAFLKQQYHVSDEQIRLAVAADRIPLEAFAGDLTPLQSVSHYLAQHTGRDAKAIARILGRTSAEVEKFLATKSPTLPKTGTHPIPASAFAGREHSASEHLVSHLEHHGLSVSEIAKLLHKAEPTIWTIHYRIQRKTKPEADKLGGKR